MGAGLRPSNQLLGLALSAVLLTSSTGKAIEFFVDQTDDGATFMLVSGEFALTSDIVAFRSAAIRSNASFVVFNSPGGNVKAALELGHTIRELKLDTVQPRFLDCASACAFAFMGGLHRFAEPGAIGMHRSSLGKSSLGVRPEDAVTAIQLHTAEIMTFMTQMGVDPSLLQLALQYDASDVRYLSMSEMEQYRVVSTTTQHGPISDQSGIDQPHRSLPDPQIAAATDEMPVFVGGKVHHPSGGANLKSAPSTTASNSAFLENGTVVRILSIADNWHQISTSASVGWLERSWMSVDGFEGGQTENRFVQIASFNAATDAIDFAQGSTLDLWVYETSTGWFAATLAGEFVRDRAIAVAAELKAQGAIPADSFVHYGNTYIRRICCE